MDICRQPFLLNCLHYNHRLWRPNSKNTNWKNCDHHLCTNRFSSNGYLFKKQWDSNGKLFSIYLLEMLQMLLWYYNFSKAYLRIFWIVDRKFLFIRNPKTYTFYLVEFIWNKDLKFIKVIELQATLGLICLKLFCKFIPWFILIHFWGLLNDLVNNF